ncbi:hypothetical protein ACFRAO_33815 [Streptomyces sp. NPDC056656]|uniref:hypothetical protein n=1 Tax=Streptomyces sp. NPDC056656 TaxID=3345895 RepID=UPI00367AB780
MKGWTGTSTPASSRSRRWGVDDPTVSAAAQAYLRSEQSMTDAEYRDLVGVLNIAEEPARPAEGPWQLVPDLALDQPGHWPASPTPSRTRPSPH